MMMWAGSESLQGAVQLNANPEPPALLTLTRTLVQREMHANIAHVPGMLSTRGPPPAVAWLVPWSASVSWSRNTTRLHTDYSHRAVRS